MTVTIRAASPDDAGALVPLMALLGHEATSDGVRDRIKLLDGQKCPQLVATDRDRLVGLCGLQVMTAIHRERSVGRITILVVAERDRGRDIGRALLLAAEAQLRELGCGMIEVTSNDRLVQAHRFYEHMGYERTSSRFMKRF